MQSELITENLDPAAVANFRRFREMVWEDARLQDRLLEFTDRETFFRSVVAAGADYGCPFDIQVVKSFWLEMQQERLRRFEPE